MGVAILVLLALVGGCAITYFLMDAPRRKGVQRLTEIEREGEQLAEEREQFEAFAERLRETREQLARATTESERRAADLTAREGAFQQRAVSYNDLAAENQLLRTELRNAALNAAYLEQTQHAGRAGADATAGQRDELGRLYFEEVVASSRRGLTPTNYPTARLRVTEAAGRVRAEGGALAPDLETRALTGLHDLFERARRVAAERDEQARVREQMREDEQRRREVEEAEAEAERAEEERRAAAEALERAVERALEEAQGQHAANVGALAGQHAAEVEALRLKLAEAEAKAQRAVSQAQLTKTGHVYIISNIGSFGNGVFKIGMTRRREPQDRVDELGDASVPFPFDVHAMIRCADAPALENALHRKFNTRRVNRVNTRKEFFRVSLAELTDAVRELHGEVEFTADAEAIEWRNSLIATDADVAELAQGAEG